MKLVFVYNADSGRLNNYLDSLHKVVSPSTYDCNLCAITFGAFKENELWKAFRESSSHEMSFLHRDEFSKEFASESSEDLKLPVVYSEEEGKLETLIPKEELDTLDSAEALIETIMKRSIDR